MTSSTWYFDLARQGARTLPPWGARRVLMVVLGLMLLASLVGMVLVHSASPGGHLVASDGIFYYEYLPSIFLDHDLDFANQRALLQAEGVQYPWQHAWLQLNAHGRVSTPFTIGWAVLTAPFFLLAQALTAMLGPVLGLRQDGYGALPEGLTALGASLYGCLGGWLIYRTLRRWWRDGLAAATALLMLLATNASYYIVVQPTMAHAVGLFTLAATLHAAARWVGTPAGAAGPDTPARPPVASAWWPLGLWGGLAILVRPQWAIAVVGLYAWAWWAGPRRPALGRAALLTAAIALLQAWVWYRLSGQAFQVPQGEGFLRYDQPQLLAVLFSLRHGLITWHPLYLVALVGLALGASRVRDPARRSLSQLCAISLLVFGLEWYVNAIVNDWWAANAFGHRRFVDLVPLLAPGTATVLCAAERWRRGRGVTAAVAAALLVWNLLFVVQYRFGYIPRAEAISWQQLTIDKFRLLSLPRPYAR